MSVSIRRDLLDHVIVMGDAHLRRLLRAYEDYYNSYRTHLGLNKDTPLVRPVLQDHPMPNSVDSTMAMFKSYLC